MDEDRPRAALRSVKQLDGTLFQGSVSVVTARGLWIFR
jgi:hypothetical protein